MKHKLIGKIWCKEPGSRRTWYNIVCTSSDFIEVGDSLIIYEDMSGDMDQTRHSALKVPAHRKVC